MGDNTPPKVRESICPNATRNASHTSVRVPQRAAWYRVNMERVPSDLQIRMEAIGGQGANSAGKILAESAALGQGLMAGHFATYGSEKRGSPVRSNVRISLQGQRITTSSPILHPDLLVIFSEPLVHTHPEVLAGLTDQTTLLMNIPKRGFFSRGKPLSLATHERPQSFWSLDAQRIANHVGCGLNAVMLGAMGALLPDLHTQTLADTLARYFSKLPPAQLQANLKGFWQGHRMVRQQRLSSGVAADAAPSRLPRMGWKNSPIGGLIANPGNTALRDNSASRKGTAPRFNRDLCYDCGYCDMICPDFCFVWSRSPNPETPPSLQGIDYQYCKGCQKCIAVCPVNALTLVNEDELPASERASRYLPRSKTP